MLLQTAHYIYLFLKRWRRDAPTVTMVVPSGAAGNLAGTGPYRPPLRFFLFLFVCFFFLLKKSLVVTKSNRNIILRNPLKLGRTGTEKKISNARKRWQCLKNGKFLGNVLLRFFFHIDSSY